MKSGKKRWKGGNSPRFGIFVKMSMAFVIVGLVPLVMVSIFSLREFRESVSSIILNNASSTLDAAATSVNGMLEEWKLCSEEMYTKEIDSGRWLSDVISDGEIPTEEKEREVRVFLASFDTSDGMKSARFLDRDKELYYVSGVVGKVADSAQMEVWKERESENISDSHEMEILPVHKDDYFSNINHDVITVKRNLYDTSGGIQNTDTRLGTLYLDISVDSIARKMDGLEFGEQSGFYIIDREGSIIYQSNDQKSMSEEQAKRLILKTGESEGITETKMHYYLCRENVEAGWISVVDIHKQDINSLERRIERYIVSILAGSSVILLILYFLFSRAFSRPISELKMGMKQIREGNLETRVAVRSKDEVGELAEGLNQMAEQLNQYISRVYRAEIRQKEAELKVLKSQINPHYLYNTLDVIRMTALENQDQKAAGMVESLARQLRYLMESEQDIVPLKEELANISDYFMLIRIRYEERLTLNLSVAEELMETPILKLILQPVVENAVKHGLKHKEGSGMLWICADQREDVLEITVMDNGVGMSAERLSQLRNRLAGNEREKAQIQGERKGIGLANVEERIRNKYGDSYGIHVESTEGKGTIVIVRLPFMGEETDEVSYDFN